MKNVLVTIAGGLAGALVFLLFIGAAFADMQCNCGPNTQNPGPMNPTAPIVHPQK